MRNMILGACVALALAACGGGGGSGGAGDSSQSLSSAGELLQAKIISPDPTLVAQQVLAVNTTTAGNQALRSIGATSDGGYTVAWISGNATLYIQRFDSSGAMEGTETLIPLSIQAPTDAAALQAIALSSMTVLSDGSVVVAYRVSRHTDQPNGTVLTKTGVYIQRFDATGVQLLGETEVASQEEVLHSRSPVVQDLKTAALADGGFVVGWTVASFSAQFGFISSLSLQRYDSQGQPVGAVVQVGQLPGLAYSIYADAHGGFALKIGQLDISFNTRNSVIHYDADFTSRLLVAPRIGAALLLPLEEGYVRFESDETGSFRLRLDSDGNPVGVPTPIPSVPVAARELADGSYVVIWAAAGGFTGQRFAADDTPMGNPLSIQTSGALPEMVALADVGFALAWTAAGGGGDTDVYTQRFVEVKSNTKKACLNSAKGLRGQERKAFMNACLA